MAIDPQRIKELLGSGLGPEHVATAVGCSASYISQLLSQPDFQNDVVELRTTALTANTKRDRSIDSIEDRLLEKLSEAVDSNMFYKGKDILYATNLVNKMNRRGVSSQQATTINNTIVNLQLPAVTVRQFAMNEHKEVIEIEGQSMVTMPAHQLLRTVSEAQKRLTGDEIGETKYDRVARFLPAAVIDAAKDINEPRPSNPEPGQITIPTPPGGSTGKGGQYPSRDIAGKFKNLNY